MAEREIGYGCHYHIRRGGWENDINIDEFQLYHKSYIDEIHHMKIVLIFNFLIEMLY